MHAHDASDDTQRDTLRSDEGLIATELAASLTVNDVSHSAAWYGDVLGFTIDRTYARDSHVFAIALRAGAVRLLLTQDDGARGPERLKGDGFSLQITTAQDIDAYASRVVANGGVLDLAPTSMPWGVRVFRLRDPDGFRFTVSSPSAGDA
jgi:uncharacterized glyoxalase superfamily protein PhnB